MNILISGLWNVYSELRHKNATFQNPSFLAQEQTTPIDAATNPVQNQSGC